jgi:hypothetical protein
MHCEFVENALRKKGLNDIISSSRWTHSSIFGFMQWLFSSRAVLHKQVNPCAAAWRMLPCALVWKKTD